MQKLKVLMAGPARNVKGGMTSVVDSYYEYGLDKEVQLDYIETVNDKNKLLKIWSIIKGYIKFSRIVYKYDIIHLHMASRRSVFRKIRYIKKAKKKSKKVIVHIHGAEYKIFYDKECNEKQKEYIRKSLNMADKIIVLSEEWKDYFTSIVEEAKIEVIYNAVMIPKNFKKDTETQKILFLGRFGKRKGIYDLIAVIEMLHKEYPKLQLYVGGDGEVEEVRNIIRQKNLKDIIHILGWVTNKEKEKYLKECSFYVLPSYNEGMPMSLIEGMAYKNISISTKVGGIPKVINNEENGMLIEPGDKKELYNTIKKLLEDKEKRLKLSENARKTVEEKFDISKNIKQLINLYCTL